MPSGRLGEQFEVPSAVHAMCPPGAGAKIAIFPLTNRADGAGWAHCVALGLILD
jgi:hypothetical protein